MSWHWLVWPETSRASKGYTQPTLNCCCCMSLCFAMPCHAVPPQENKDAFEIETLEVELFGPDGRIKDIWMFR